MAELRQDPASGRWVIIAVERAARPHDFYVPRGTGKGGFCPFCEGNEDRTPPEVMAVRPADTAPDTPGWQVRVVPNRFPALEMDSEVTSGGDGLYRSVGGHGAHEVVIESPRHLVSPTEMTPEDLALVVRAWCERSRVLSRDDGVSYVLVFKNVGVRAGASIEHAHSQLIAVPVLPKRVAEELRGCAEFYRQNSRCLFCSIIEREKQHGRRMVIDREGFVVISTYAARFPFEMCILPTEHSQHFQDLGPEQMQSLAAVLHEALARLDVCLKGPPFNFAIHTAPVDHEEAENYHWHIEVIPRVTHVAGFEWGTGFYINPMEPETAAEHLRAVSERQVRAQISSAPASGGSEQS